MNRNLQKIEKDLRSIAKRYKSVKYSIGLAILFLMMGLNAFSADVSTELDTANYTGVVTREGIKDSVDNLQDKIKGVRLENTKSIEALRLELIQLMEQGGQVIKSPWASWQFGINYVYNSMSGMYKGRGDKPPKYVYNSIYRRGNWEERNALDVLAGKTVNGGPITPGNENTNTWQITNGLLGGANLKRDLSIDASTNGGREWGLVDLRKIREPLNEIEILARVSPKEVKKDKLDIPVSVTPPATLSAPVVNPNVNKPTEAPKVDLPKPPKLEIPGDPNLSVNPTISVLKVEKVGAITIDIPEVKPVDFIVEAGGLSGVTSRNFHAGTSRTEYNLSGPITVTGNDFISTWGNISKIDKISNNVTVTGTKTRAFMIDEGIDYNKGTSFVYNNSGTIRLRNSETVGLDVQGTHTSYSQGAGQSVNPSFNTIDKVADIKVTNKGTIIGEGAAGGVEYEKQVAFGFNNFDTSSNNTRTEMINEGTVTLGAKNSVGIQLRPEDPHASDDDPHTTEDMKPKRGLNMMTGENRGTNATITLNGAGSFGILTVKNKDLRKLKQTPPVETDAETKNYTEYGTITPAGGQIASRGQEVNKSLIKNSGIINVQSDSSVGVGLLNSIQSVEVGGKINIGTATTLATYADKTGGVSGKVDGAVGVYTEVATRPVAASTYKYTADGQQEFEADGVTPIIDVASKDDHGVVNTEHTTTTYYVKDANGNYVKDTVTGTNKTALKYTGKPVGTDTVEVSAEITLGDNSIKSFGLRNSKTGSITLLGGGKVEVKGEKNFGALSNAAAGKININQGAEIKGTGKESIGYAMLKGTGINAGTIDVEGPGTNTATSKDYNGSLGFYGVKGTFTNTSTGKIITSGTLAHSVVLKQNSTTQGEMTFNHYGEINVSSASTKPGNIGVYSDGYALANFYNGAKVYVGDDSIGVHTSRIDGFNHTFINEGTLGITIGARSTFAYLDAEGTPTETTLKEFFGNGKVVIESDMGEKSSLVYANNQAKALLDADLTIDKGDAAASTIALLATNKSAVTVDSGKTLTTNTQVALAAVNETTTVGNGSTAENKGTIVSDRRNDGIGIYAKDTGSKATNDGTITMMGNKAVGMYGENVTTLENKTGKSIEVKEKESVGMYAKVTGTNTLTAQNDGTIITNKDKSVGIYLQNDETSPIIANLKASNKKVEIKGGTESIGIYAPKATISDVGTITMENDIKKSIAAYISDGGKITNASTASINLGTSGKNIAYYVKNAGTSIGGANVGTVKGYGVGVYLEGTKANPTVTPAVPASQATLGANAPELKFNNGTTDGNGIIGLYLKGDTDISTYEKKITVGNTVGTNSAIGIYSDAQGVSGTPYVIKANITTGAKAVGIFSAPDREPVPPATTPTLNKSYIKYLGSQMNLGEGSTGFYVNGKTELDTTTTTTPTTTINLDGGLVAYVTENSEFVGGNSKVNLSKSGIGVYGERGAKVDVGSWTFNNNGNAAEEVRLKEGQAKVTTNKDLKPKMVLTHVINGETYLDTGKTVTATGDPTNSNIIKQENIGLMAQGVKDPTAPANVLATGGWKEADYEITNYGTINFKDSIKSTAIYAESARVKNEGKIELGESSTGIYGVYRADTDSLTGVTNTVKVATTANSKIILKKDSTGMYLVNAENLTTAAGGTIQSVAGETNNVGIYAINGKVDVPTTGSSAEITEANAYNNKNANFKSLTMTNKSNITLGNGSVGIYTRGQDNSIPSAVRNTVTNDGNITVGDTLTGAPAVGIYAENTNLTQGDTGTPNITVGKEGIALYGKNSTITAKGTVNYSNKGILGYFENSIFTSHYGDLTAHQNTILFLKNSTANMNGAGKDIDITVPDKAATSVSFAGVYVEGTSTLNGVKKITVGENSNGIFMKNATFTSNVIDIESTKEGAKALLAVESDLTNNSKITLSGDSSIGIYSDATVSPTKTVTNNGKLTISGKKTLGVFLKGNQTFVNTADIDVADTTSSVPAEKTVGIYTKDGTSTIKHNSGTINVGTKSIGIFSATNSGVEVDTPAKINVKDEAIGIYKEKGTALLKGEIDVAAHTSTTKNSEPVGLYGLNGADITDSASKITVGAKSFGFILENETPATTNKYTSTGAGTVSLGDDSVFLYSNGQASLTNGRDISSNSDRVIGFYIKGNATNRGDLTNNATIDFSNSKGSIGIYAPGGKATNKGRILVGKTDSIDPATGLVYSDVSKITYGIGMAADNGGHIINDNEIRVYGDKSIGMYGKGAGTKVENNGTIFLDGSRATDTNKIQSMVGVYVDEGATFINKGTIRTADAYAGKDVGGTIKVNTNVVGLVGVAVMNGSTLKNYGNIDIDANESFGVVVRNSVIQNFGTFKIKVRGKGTYGVSYKDISAADLAALEAIVNSKLTSDPTGQELAAAGGVNKSYEGVSITIQNGKPIFTRNGVLVSDAEVEKIEKIIGEATSNLGMSDVGFYVDTLGRTKPIDIDGATPPINSQLIVGTEYSELTNKKEWFVKDDVIAPFLQQIQGRNFKLTSIAGSLTWMATPVLDNYGQIKGVAMTKLPYTAFVEKSHNAWNFADGLEQRYGMNALDSREKRVFNLLNSIGNNEEILLTQAYDEMMGHQYANVQQRIYETGNILNREFSYLRNAWSNPTKDANKVKVFGTNGEYKTDTAGIIDYKYNAQGVAYVHEDESVKLGETVGWYAGLVHNRYKFEDIGRSKEEMLQGKVGMFKSVPFDDNNSLNWTISGDVFVGYNKMHRRFLVVNEIFNAKSRYYSYGLGVKNELSKEFRLSEGFALKPYGALRLEYGRMSKIRERSGEVKLEVKSNDYISIKPEIGAELSYRAFFGPKSLKAAVTVAYENELGVLANPKNKARVAGTSADWFNIRGEKEDRRGNVKTDLNIGVDNQRIGVTANVGYDTKGNNIRGGLGLRVIF